jgi:murein DD-endopeptidase MepM/ murein hydrolase activator NlpD
MSDWMKSLRFFVTHGRLPVRERYWRKRSGGIRLRYTLAGCTTLSATCSFMILSLLPIAPPSPAPLLAHESLAPAITVALAPSVAPSIPMRASAPSDTAPKTVSAPVIPGIKPGTLPPSPLATTLDEHRDPSGQIRRNPETRLAQNAVDPSSMRGTPGTRQHNLTIAAGDTLSTLLIRAGVSPEDSDRAIKAMRPHIQGSDLRPGQTLELEMADAQAPYQFNRLTLAMDPVKSIEVRRGWGGLMTAAITEKPLERDIAAHSTVIKASLYGAAANAGIPASITTEAIKAFGHQIDFQRDIHPGDRLEIMYDRQVTSDGFVAKNGNLLYARLYASGRELSIYRFETKDGRVDYFDPKGHSIRKALLRTPMDGARLTSGFGMRRHPILGYSKMHKGVDFGAPTGTPIYAAGDGVVEKAGRFGAYGHYVRLRHNNRIQTAYAHLSRYGQGIRPGVRVRQGQIIGYVGSTGRSTGPHLHYEILVNGTQVNPQGVKMPTMVVLEGADKKKFSAMVEQIDREFREKTNGIRYASANGTTDAVQ